MRALLPLLALAGCASHPLEEAVTVDAVLEHLGALQDIADDHDGTRAAFTDGYDASADYVEDLLEAAGYEVSRHTITVSWPTVHDAALSEVAPEARDFDYLPEDGSGFSVRVGGKAVDVTTDVYAIDLVLPPGEQANTSTSGCEASDYDGFPEGAIALVQRGTCAFSTKAAVATGAGAAALLMFNEGQEGRTERIDGASLVIGDPGVPFFSLAYDLGADLAAKAEAGGLRVHAYADVTFEEISDDSVIAETADGDPDRTILVGAHLDSVPAGPGINDNGSGSSLVLELALQVAETGLRPDNRIRFAWWASEELGLIGSRLYVEDHGTPEWAVFNYDMVASPNGFPMVYDADGTFSGYYDPPPGTELMEEAVTDWFIARDLPWGEVPALTASDSEPWVSAGAPVGGIYTGSSETLSGQLQDIFGGTAGEPLDACYHEACDTLDNLDEDLLARSAGAAAHALERLATYTGKLGE